MARGTDVMFAQHHWPRWGKARLIEHLARHRDMYRYLHDQTLRLANRGLTPTEIAAEVRLPPSLERTWSCRGYYGTVSHNMRAVYQRYLGFFDGNPAHLNPHPPVQAGQRYVDLAGGIEAMLASARRAFAAGDYRWVAELCSHAVFADPECSEACEICKPRHWSSSATRRERGVAQPVPGRRPRAAPRPAARAKRAQRGKR